MIYRALILAALAALVAAPAALGAKEPPTPAEQAAVAAAVAPSLVRVEYTLRVDKGEEPYAGGWSRAGPPTARRRGYSSGSVLEEERPLETSGFLVSPTQVVTGDIMIHPRFIEGVAVRQGDELVKAHVAGWFKTNDAVLVELEKPFKAAKPLAFEAKKKGPYLAVSYEQIDGEWTTVVGAWSPSVLVAESGRKYVEAPSGALIVDESAAPVGLSMNDELPPDDSWQVSPLKWAFYTEADRAAMLDALQKKVDRAMVRVTLHFRSPKKETGARYRGGRDDDEQVTEAYVTGIILADGRVLVLANLRPKVTARLERVEVHPARQPSGQGTPAVLRTGEAGLRPGEAVPGGDAAATPGAGDPVTAKFEASLKDYGCFTARLDKPLAGAMAFSAAPIRDTRFALLPAAEIRVHGEERTVYFNHSRIFGFDLGWRRQLYPEVAGRDEAVFLFDPAGALVALPVAHREKVTTRDRYYSSRDGRLTAAAYLGEVLSGDLAKASDPHNVPLTEAEERRLAWLGLELQPLTRDLARENKVSDLTHDGMTGAMVSYVYPDSPAAKAGVEAGWILLRLQVEGQPKPLEVQVTDEMDRGAFPWERLDEVSEQYFERIPQPWPTAENTFARALTDLGFGTKFKADFFHDSRSVSRDFAVTAGPPYFDSAPSHKAAALGLTVRDLSYEVRRYFQKGPQEPGVIVSKIEPGSKASVAGVKPYEIITHVNDKPMMNVVDFEQAVGQPGAVQEAGQPGELRLSVKRMTQGRVVKINLATPAPPRPAPPAAPKAGAPPANNEAEPALDEPPASAPKSRPPAPAGKKAPGAAGG